MALVWLFLQITWLLPLDFKTEQLQHVRVKAAYQAKEKVVATVLQNNGILPGQLNLYVIAFKQEQVVEIWGKNSLDLQYKLIQKMPVCRLYGTLGPKRREGDLQVPEGFYTIDGFNPNSNFHLSLHVNYPNKSDQILGYKPKLGGNIFLHGDCVTIGCLPLTDEKIKELYIYCIEAKSSGQSSIPITIFPARLTEPAYKNLSWKYAFDADKLNLWADLKKGYDYFELTKQLPAITFLPDGRHLLE